MERAFITLVFSICFVQNSLGLPSLTCNDVDPILPSTVKCSCQNVGASGISWYRDGVFITSCILLSGQCFTSMGYTFTVDSKTSTYTIEFGSYNYTECTIIKCSDSTTPSESDFQRISVDVTNYSPTLSVVNEPASSHMDGNIDFTTDCIYKANSSDINVKTAKWTAVVNGTEEDDLDIKGTISKTGSCQFCTDDFASKISVSYIHQEEHSESRIKANIRLKLLIDELPYEGTTKYEYYVKGKNESSVSITTTSITNSTSDVIKITTTNSDENGIHYKNSSIPNSTFVNAVPEKEITQVKYATVLYTGLACYTVISTVVMITYCFCLTTNERKTNEHENNQRDQQYYTDIYQTSRL